MGSALQKADSFRDLIYYISIKFSEVSGNVIGENQRSMVESRIKKRMLELGDLGSEEYLSLLKRDSSELNHLVGLLTTHHTFFFREFIHFEYILKNLEGIIASVKARGESKIRLLSAACSRGEEAYSLAMFFSYHLKDYPGVDFEIVANDIDKDSVAFAKNGIYRLNDVKQIPKIYLEGNWQKGTGDIANFAKIKKSIQDKIKFGQGNLLNLNESLANQKFDIIFCRNVFIYFDIEKVFEITKNFKKYIFDNGLFITGLSESLKKAELVYSTNAPSVYHLHEQAEEEVEEETFSSKIPHPIKVLCVDDSKAIIKILQKIFENDSDFEFVGFASDGDEAAEKVKCTDFDIMTLDIHMPNLSGVEYLEKYYKREHPPVLMISSASREDSRYAQRALSLGAYDFVEKPSLNNLSERSEEIKNKLKMAFFNRDGQESKFDKEIKHSFSIEKCEDKTRFVVVNYSDVKLLKGFLDSLTGDQPPLFVFTEGNPELLELFKNKFGFYKNVSLYKEGEAILPNHIYVADFASDFRKVEKKTAGQRFRSLAVFGKISKNVIYGIKSSSIPQILIEDETSQKTLAKYTSDVFPWTSFEHVGTEFLARDSKKRGNGGN